MLIIIWADYQALNEVFFRSNTALNTTIGKKSMRVLTSHVYKVSGMYVRENILKSVCGVKGDCYFETDHCLGYERFVIFFTCH